ncbi:LegC family aminotransferase [Sporosarcina gallistercoris]|uniref:LegC family aminotransferase n=1 Tax=Sporosarcina gallistercoris TaxID=2762245 RepID=A0ABR8PN62_9BACL|nr:LegC family aminotransferase [Sporosarcina gallistercoris]MBD7909612.1 LegC family aminotransferase [Sporosarcina gallistercoris]
MNDEWFQFAKEVKKMYGKDFVPLHEPTFDNLEICNVTDCIQTGWVSSVGKYVDQFERDLAEYTGVKRAVAVVNGTAALQIALKIAGVQADDEVFMPALTFIATANAATYLGAIPHFVDVSTETLGLDPFKLDKHIQSIGVMKDNQLVNKSTGRIIRAVVPMHTFGHPVDLDPLLDVCQKYNLILVEDAAESLGSYYKGKHTGGFGRTAALSFNGNKIITTGGGGAILTNDEALADYAKHITTTAKVPHSWEFNHDEIGYNYRMPNINAALGCAQLQKLDGFIASKRTLTQKYVNMLMNNKDAKLFVENPNTKSNYWLQTLQLKTGVNRDTVVQKLNNAGVMARPIWIPLNTLDIFQMCPSGDLSVTYKLQKEIINIPSSPIKFSE